MATKEFPLQPQEIEPIHTRYRTLRTPIPVPESVPFLTKLRETEPRSMGGQPPVIWHSGEGATVCDPYGNRWIDFSSGVLVTSCGHSHPDIVKAIRDMADQGLYHAYCFPTDVRFKLIEELSSWLPPPLKRVFLLTTGSEACECCIKLARTQGLRVGGKDKNIFVSFDHGFHGRTMGAQLAGGAPALKEWLGGDDPCFVQVPFPDGFRQKDTGFAVFEATLKAEGVDPSRVCGVMSETYQGCNATLMPPHYAQGLRAWCDKHQAVMIFDEVQAGFGRTGAPFGFSHLGVVPDLVACGKGIAGGMPVAAVLGTDELMGIYGPGEMTSTHSANPVCAAAALANLQVIRREELVENAARLAPVMAEAVRRIKDASKGCIGHVDSTGLVGALQFARPGTTEPMPEWAWEVVWGCVCRGLLLFAPVGVGGCAIKLNPPLVISEDALREGLAVVEEVVQSMSASTDCRRPHPRCGVGR